MKQAKISVIIPVYKVESYLRRCLDSVIGQTYRNLEIILVDDGSPDNCGAICDAYAAQDARVRVIHQENGGAFTARNAALDVADGAYIGFVDADDWLEPTMYAELMALMEESGADIAQCEACNEGRAQLRQVFLDKVAIYRGKEITGAFFRDEVGHSLTNKLFRASFWEGLRFRGDLYHEDAMVVSQCAGRCDSVARTDRVLYHYNTTNASITRGQKNPLHVKSMEVLFGFYEEAAKDASPDGAFYICREIPSAGRQIRPSKEIPRAMALAHIRHMHRIFKRNWPEAKTAEAYRHAPDAKKVLWHIYRRCPVTASVLVYMYARLK